MEIETVSGIKNKTNMNSNVAYGVGAVDGAVDGAIDGAIDPADEYNYLKMMKLTDINYNKIKKSNRHQLSYNSNNPRQSEVNSKIQFLYDELDIEFNNFKNNISSSCFKHKMIKVDKSNICLTQSLLKSSYIPSHIVAYIIDKAKFVLEYNCDLGNGRTVKINFILFGCNRYELNNIRKKGASYFKRCVLKIYIWLKILSKYSKEECGKNLECFIYLTPFKRKLPSYSDPSHDDGVDVGDGDNIHIYEAGNGSEKQQVMVDRILTPSHVNGGLSDICQLDGQIIVYRSEEWFKVFIHETMHNYGVDFSTLDLTMANKKIQSIFSIQTNVKLFESYCEIWARIMNVFFESYFVVNRQSQALFIPLSTRKKMIHKIHKNNYTSVKNGRTYNPRMNTSSDVDKKQRFLNIFYDNLKHESIFSIFQCVKILNFMGLDYNIISNCNDANYIIVKKMYKEETNVFAYYIIVAILMANFNNFILWCIDNNTNLFNFKKEDSSVDNFVMFISKNYKNSELLGMIVHLEKRLENRQPDDELLLHTLRMTIIGEGR